MPGLHIFSGRAAAALLLCLCLGFLAAPAQGARLMVTGPPGAEVVIDGEVKGVLPLASPIELPHSVSMQLEVRRAGYISHEEQLWLDTAATETTIQVDLLALSRKTAVISSAILAGTGQFYQGRRTAGFIQIGLQAAAWTSVIMGELSFQSKRDDYESLDQEYQEALAPPEIARLRDEREMAWDDMEGAKTWRNVSLGAVAAIAVWSAVDAWRGHNRFYASIETPVESTDGDLTFKTGLRFGFGEGAR